MSSITKRAAIDDASPLDDAGILFNVLSTIGPGHHLFISAVSKAWRESYERVASVQVAGLVHGYDTAARRRTLNSHMTLYSAVFASAARVHWAYKHVTFGFDARMQRIAGRVADVDTLKVAHELGLDWSSAVLIGAAESASVVVLQWLHREQKCELPADISNYAARSGRIDTLQWLKALGSMPATGASVGAAAGAHVHVLQALHDDECDHQWDERVRSAAAKHGNLTTVKWLHEHWFYTDREKICGDAAESGSIEMLLYLKQQGCRYNAGTMARAARRGHLAVCQHLVAEQCPLDETVCAAAARGGALEIVRSLRNNSCPWHADLICDDAAQGDSIELMQYLRQHGCDLSEEAMETALRSGDAPMCQYLRTEQCPWVPVSSASRDAAAAGHVELLRWLLEEQGCPYDLWQLRYTAALSGCLPAIKYLHNLQPAATPAQLLKMLTVAGAYNNLPVAKWLRQQGAQWPAVLRYGWNCWSRGVVMWARRRLHINISQNCERCQYIAVALWLLAGKVTMFKSNSHMFSLCCC
jgi:hypothetical protein